MSTDTNDLIGKLAADLKPVRPIAPLWLRVTLLTVFTLGTICAFICGFTHGFRADWQVMTSMSGHLCETFWIFGAGVLAGCAAFILSVPDTKIRAHVYAMVGIATLVWVSLMAREMLKGPFSLTSFGERNCLTDLALLIVVPFVAATVFVMRAAPVWRGWAGYALMLSVSSFAALGMRFLCPNEAPAHLLVWHFAPVVAFALFGIGLGEILLKWKIAKI